MALNIEEQQQQKRHLQIKALFLVPLLQLLQLVHLGKRRRIISELNNAERG